MAKIYTKKTLKSLNPQKKTISFLLNYSKSIKVFEIKRQSFMFHLN